MVCVRLILTKNENSNGVLGAFFVFGYMTAAWVGVACFFSKNAEFQWRFALSLQILWPMIMAGLVFYIPESPRWRRFIYSLLELRTNIK